MGIHNLNKFLRKKCPNIFKNIHISEFAYKKVAIDITLFLCKFKSICGEKWVSAFINLVASLRRNEIHCVFIFDNGSPIEKTLEREQRRKQQEIIKKKVIILENALEKYKITKVIDPVIIELYNKMSPSEKPTKRLLGGGDSINMASVETKIKKMRNYILNICEDDFILAKKLFDILNVPYYLATLEAECTCADLCKRGIVDAVLTEDTDVLAYGSPIFLSKIDTSNDTCVQINYKDVLKELNINSDEFLDLCIMFGCDYNTNINKIGIATAYKYITKYRSIDEIEKQLKIDVSVLKHIRCRELFKNYEQLNLENVPFCGSPNFVQLKNFISEYKLVGLNFEKIKSHFFNTNIKILHEDDVEESEENSKEDDVEESEENSKEDDVEESEENSKEDDVEESKVEIVNDIKEDENNIELNILEDEKHEDYIDFEIIIDDEDD